MGLLILFYTWLISWNLSGQEPLTRWMAEVDPSSKQCLDDWWIETGLNQRGYLKRMMTVDDWIVLEIPEHYVASLKALPCVINITKDLQIGWRDTEPNDPAFINQADMDLIGMPEAWDITQGGVTAQGDTIVVAILDNGFNLLHEDLKENIWVNREEIPGDNIDNDGNGYIDDYRGINIETGNDAHAANGSHGTEVSGIIGARGNNGIGIAGINWRVKLMWVSGADFESELIESYQYVLEMRKEYRISNGQRGAFVVVTNLSAGVSHEFAVDHPLWCEMYDKLGEEGILSITAAPNQSISVDEFGDMATTCPSPFMITVTNVDVTDALLANAGFGPVSIDMGAPGSGTLTTTGINQYKETSGTSAAAPHVAGAVALIYSTPCPTFLADIDSDPEGLALRIKDIVLNTGKDNNSLEGITVTGKRLQVDAALNETISSCDSIMPGGVRITSVRRNPSTVGDLVQIFFQVNGDTTTASFDIYTVDGKLIETYDITGEEFNQGYITLEVKPVPAGLYFITLRNKKEKDTVKLVTGFK